MSPEILWYQQGGFPLLSALVFLPLLAAAVAWFANSQRQAFLVGIAGTGLELVLAFHLLSAFADDTARLQFAERLQLLPFFSYHLAVDGISVLFVALTALLSFLLVLYGEIVHERPPGLYMASLLAFESVLMGLFLAVDWLQFWVLACIELIPTTLILGRWGTGSDRLVAVKRYLQFTGAGLALLLVGILLIGWNHYRIAGAWSFDLVDLAANPAPLGLQSVVFVLVFYGLAVRMSQFPFHAWLPEVAQHGTLATACVFLVGLKVSLYALLRFVLPVLPDAVDAFKELAAGLGIVGVFYGALLALMQSNLRRLLAFAAVSHTGMLVAGVFCANAQGLAGTLLLTVNFGVAASGMLFVAGLLFRRAGSLLLPRLGGLFDVVPVLGITFMIAALSTMAMPGTPGFDAAHLLLEGIIETHDWTMAVAVAIGNVLAAAFLLWAFQRIFLAHRKRLLPRPERNRLTMPEAALAVIVCSVLLGVGFYTKPWLEMVDESAEALAERYYKREDKS
jgi:NADH-quinone oxidoreductase subunit M